MVWNESPVPGPGVQRRNSIVGNPEAREQRFARRCESGPWSCLKSVVFSFVSVALFFILAELLLAGFGVRPVVLTQDPLVGFADNVPLFVEVAGEDGSSVMRTPNSRLRLFNYQEFPRRKGEEAYRIFCMGGSTTYGRPYSDSVSFCGWLRAYLAAADNTRRWEVINAGGISFASYRVARLMTQLSQYDPDLFIVYTGQNEFLEQRSYGPLAKLPGWLLNLNTALSATRVYSAMVRAYDALQSQGSGGDRTSQLGTEEALLNQSVGPGSYHRDEDLKRQIIAHYRLNLQRMVKIARSAGADIVFVQPAVNLKDMSPFKSEHRADLDATALRRWQQLYDAAVALQQSDKPHAALALYRDALAIDDRYAELHFRMGRALFGLGQYQAAQRAFTRALDEDIVPLRIVPAMQRVLSEVAASEDVPLVDLPAILSEAYRKDYGHAVFGEEYFRDHVHLNMEGYRRLALALLEQLTVEGVANPTASWGPERIEAVRREVIAEQDPSIEGTALVNLGKVLDWAGKHEEALAAFQGGMDVLGPSPKLYDRLARSAYLLGRSDESIRYLRDALDQFPGVPGVHSQLARLLANRGDIEEAIAHCRAELEIDPTDQYVHAGLATLLEDSGDSAGARLHYELALELERDYEYALVKLALLQLKEGEYDAALQHSRAALRVNPDQFRAHYAIAAAMERRGKVEQALRHYAEALRLQPQYGPAEDGLRRLAARHSDPALLGELAR